MKIAHDPDPRNIGYCKGGLSTDMMKEFQTTPTTEEALITTNSIDTFNTRLDMMQESLNTVQISIQKNSLRK